MADKLTKVTQPVLDGNLSNNGNSAFAFSSETAGRISGTPSPNKIYGTNVNGIQEFMVPDSKDFPKIYASTFADKISGNVLSNCVWGTNENGEQGWIILPEGNMNSSIYDPSNSGKVESAVTSDKISGSPLANQVWGTNSVGRQMWLDLIIDDVMLKSDFCNIDTTSKYVDNARYAEQIRSGLSAENNTVYYKNSEGHFDWINTSDLIPNEFMKVEVYDKSGSGKIDLAEQAEGLLSETNASNSTFYGKSLDGTVGFKNIEDISRQVMLKSEYDKGNTGSVEKADSINVTSEIELNSVYTNTSEGQKFVKPSLEIVTGGNGKIELPGNDNWIVFYSIDGEAKTAIASGEFTWEPIENKKEPAWAIKLSF